MQPTPGEFRHILVATDFSACSDAALAHGRALARTFDGTFRVLHVVEAAAARDWLGADAVAAALPELRSSLETAQRTRLDGLLTADDAALGAVAVMRSFEPPGEAIVDEARANHCDLIVIGTHGRKGLAHLVMGSVATAVVRSAPCPVLVVPAPSPAAGAPDAATSSSH